MIANSLTVHSHPKELYDFIDSLHQKGIEVINSAVFNGGFLIGSDYYNYQLVDKSTEEGNALYAWRDKFFKICNSFGVKPAEACFNYSYRIPGIVAVALNTTKPEKIKLNVEMVTREIPKEFWDALVSDGLI